jgi:hypothetical protein
MSIISCQLIWKKEIWKQERFFKYIIWNEIRNYMFMPYCFRAPIGFYFFWFSNIMALSLPDEDYSMSLSLPDEDYSTPTTPKVSRVTPVRPRGTRSKTTRTLTKSGKPAARVVKVVTPPDFHESPLPTIRRPKLAKQRKRVQSTPQAPQQPPTSTTSITPRTAQSTT